VGKTRRLIRARSKAYYLRKVRRFQKARKRVKKQNPNWGIREAVSSKGVRGFGRKRIKPQGTKEVEVAW